MFGTGHCSGFAFSSSRQTCSHCGYTLTALDLISSPARVPSFGGAFITVFVVVLQFGFGVLCQRCASHLPLLQALGHSWRDQSHTRTRTSSIDTLSPCDTVARAVFVVSVALPITLQPVATERAPSSQIPPYSVHRSIVARVVSPFDIEI